MRIIAAGLVVASGLLGQWFHTHSSGNTTPARVYHAGSIYPEVRRAPVEQAPDDFRTLDELYHPGETVAFESVVAERAQRRVAAHGGSLDRAELDAVLALAGWPEEARGEAAAVAWCESRWSPYARGDGGNSLGLFQLWSGWFPWAHVELELWNDSVANARVALAVYRRDLSLGRNPWSQWSCQPDGRQR